MKRQVLGTLCLVAVLAAAEPAGARVVRVEVRTRAALLGAKAFGLAGPYEKVSGTMFFAVRPGDPRDDAIVDLVLAPRNAAAVGSYVPFSKSRADRERAGDPRQSLEERYGSRERYLGLIAEAAMAQVRERFLLAEDLADVLSRGAAEWDAAVK